MNILAFGCMHIPYHHPDSIKFLEAVADKFKVDKVRCLEDTLDNHANSRHDTHPDLRSSGDEFESAFSYMRSLYRTFPSVDCVKSNHWSMPLRKAISNGLSKNWVKTVKEAMSAPDGWNWHDTLIDNLGGLEVLYLHDPGRDITEAAKNNNACIVAAHKHTKMSVEWVRNNRGRAYWTAHTGCLIDNTSYAFAYNKKHKNSPVIGCVVIEDIFPRIVPMITRGGRWTGKIK